MWSKETLYAALNEFPLRKHKNLFIHTNLGLSGICETNPLNPHGVFLDVMQKIAGSRTSFFLPAFTYSFGSDEVFRPYSDYGLEKMGVTSQQAFARNYHRTFDPMFSLLGYGNGLEKFLSRNSVNSSHGKGSHFARLVDDNAGLVLVNVGCSTTLIHELEYRLDVPYRFMKEFSGFYQINQFSSPVFANWSAFVNRREITDSEADFVLLNRDLICNPDIGKAKLGRGYIVYFDVNFLINFLVSKLEINPWYLTRFGQTLKTP